jgi:hypothetical protein
MAGMAHAVVVQVRIEPGSDIGHRHAVLNDFVIPQVKALAGFVKGTSPVAQVTEHRQAFAQACGVHGEIKVTVLTGLPTRQHGHAPAPAHPVTDSGPVECVKDHDHILDAHLARLAPRLWLDDSSVVRAGLRASVSGWRSCTSRQAGGSPPAGMGSACSGAGTCG